MKFPTPNQVGLVIMLAAIIVILLHASTFELFQLLISVGIFVFFGYILMAMLTNTWRPWSIFK